MGAAAQGSVWGSCRYCGTAVAPGAGACGLCGADHPISAGTMSREPVAVRRRVSLFNWLRAAIMIGVAVALAWALIDAVATGPPNVADPLTTSATYTVAPGTLPILTGEVTGGDYVVGNFTSVAPYEADISLSAYNSTEWNDLIFNHTGTPAWSTPSEGSGRIVFTAEYTDTFTFVLTNSYPASSNLTIKVYVATQYESNVGDDGFG
jgi:hypothetical protein